MGFKPIDRMWERVEMDRFDSDAALFASLMYFGELLTKLVTLGLVGSIDEESKQHRYRLLHRLVRADSLGDWSEVIDDVLIGAASSQSPRARDERRELTQKCQDGEWQYRAVAQLDRCLRKFDPGTERIPTKISGRRWFDTFVQLRNKTRGHGAPALSHISGVCTELEESIRTVIEHHSLFRRNWAYVRQNTSGRRTLIPLTEKGLGFTTLSEEELEEFVEGVYVYFEEPVHIQLLEFDPATTDFHFPNGAFRKRSYEVISYHTGNTRRQDAGAYLEPAVELPPSGTQGLGLLDPQGNCFGNLPPKPSDYVNRRKLEEEVLEELLDDRHPMVTLSGRGGIGKTSVALSALHEITSSEQPRFFVVIWFSARDIDLLPGGPKPVRPQILTRKDAAHEFAQLIEPQESKERGFDVEDYFANMLTESTLGPLLIVFDNFETVHNPVDFFLWLDRRVRSPNKILITTRYRDFKGDYSIEVPGMEQREAYELIDSTALRLGITRLITDQLQEKLWSESEGHPYVIRVLLGEIAKSGVVQKIERVFAPKEEILNALFQRVYDQLTPHAKRVFLTLCSWRSVIPQLALEAVLIRDEDRIDIEAAVTELSDSSLVEITESERDNSRFLSIPLVAAEFGRMTLEVSPLKTTIQANTLMLQEFGAAQQSDVRHGIAPRIERLLRRIQRGISTDEEQLETYLPMLEYIANQYLPAWLDIATLYAKFGSREDLERAKEIVLRYLARAREEERQKGWEMLIELAEITGDWMGEIHARVEMCESPDVPFWFISKAAHRLNGLLRSRGLVLDSGEKEILANRLAHLMETRIEEADAIDCSRLAWLYIHLKDLDKAKDVTRYGLYLNPTDRYCRQLAQRLELAP